MFSLLVLSLALSAPSAAVQESTAANDPPLPSSQPFVLIQPDMPTKIEPETQPHFDAMEIHPDSDICYKIRAFIFSQGSHPRLQRETTCGPKAPTSKNVEGAKPKLVPLHTKDEPTDLQQK